VGGPRWGVSLGKIRIRTSSDKKGRIFLTQMNADKKGINADIEDF
jgi:hypothetical protein